MTQCTKQFDPLKKWGKRSGEKADYLKIVLIDDKCIQAWKIEGELPRFYGSHYPCGHYWYTHHDSEDDLINVEEESVEPLKINQLREQAIECRDTVFSLMQKLAKFREVLSDLSD